MSLPDRFGLINSFISVKEYGQYTVQECSISKRYVIWDKKERVHLTKSNCNTLEGPLSFKRDTYYYDNNGLLLFYDKENAEDYAKFLGNNKEAEFTKMHPEFEENYEFSQNSFGIFDEWEKI